jgi:hypothetical protein
MVPTEDRIKEITRMVATVLVGVYTMKDRCVIENHNAKCYQRETKKVKNQMLNELSVLLYMNRQYLAWLLRTSGKGRTVIVATPTMRGLSRRGRKRVYGDDVLKVLERLWHISGFVSSKHLVAFIDRTRTNSFTRESSKIFSPQDRRRSSSRSVLLP